MYHSYCKIIYHEMNDGSVLEINDNFIIIILCTCNLLFHVKSNPDDNFFSQSVVQFRHKEDAEKAIKELHGTEFKGRTIHIREVGQPFLPMDVQCNTCMFSC